MLRVSKTLGEYALSSVAPSSHEFPDYSRDLPFWSKAHPEAQNLCADIKEVSEYKH